MPIIHSSEGISSCCLHIDLTNCLKHSMLPSNDHHEFILVFQIMWTGRDVNLTKELARKLMIVSIPSVASLRSHGFFRAGVLSLSYIFLVSKQQVATVIKGCRWMEGKGRDRTSFSPCCQPRWPMRGGSGETSGPSQSTAATWNESWDIFSWLEESSWHILELVLAGGIHHLTCRW